MFLEEALINACKLFAKKLYRTLPFLESSKLSIIAHLWKLFITSVGDPSMGPSVWTAASVDGSSFLRVFVVEN